LTGQLAEPGPRSARVFGLLAVVLAAAAGGLAFWVAPPGFVGRSGADATFAALASGMDGGHGLAYPYGLSAVPATVPPLFAVLLLPAAWLGQGRAVDAVTWMQAISALVTISFVLAAYAACRKALGLSPAVSLAAIAPAAVHPVLVRFGAAAVPDVLAAALCLATLALAGRAEHRVAARASVAPQARLEVPVYAGNAGELLGIAVMPREAPRRSLLDRAQIVEWWPVAVAAALAALAGHVAILVLLALVGALLLRRRAPEAIGLVCLSLAMTLPWAAWALLQGGVAEAFSGTRWDLAAVPHALWIGLAYALPGWLIPQVFLAGFPLGGEAAGAVGRMPQNLLAVWGLLMAATILGPLWALRKADAVAAQATGFFALLAVAAGLAWACGFAAPADRGEIGRLLLPAAPVLGAGLWLWKAGEHRFERLAAERFKGYAALGWVVLVVGFAPVAVAPVRQDAERFATALPERWALFAAVGQIAGPDDLVATARPASMWLYSGRRAVALPPGARDLAAEVKASGARYVVGDLADETQTEAFAKAAALDPDWSRPVYTTPDKRFAILELR